MDTIHELITQFPRRGRLEWIGAASERLAPLQSLSSATLQPGSGIDGEHHAQSGRSHRQLTLIQQEHLPVIAGLSGLESIDPQLLRRNLVVSGVNLLALKRGRFRIGGVLIEGTGPCAPCSRMEQNLGPGGYNAMRGHGGITARVLEAGTIRVGDELTVEQGFEPDEKEAS